MNDANDENGGYMREALAEALAGVERFDGGPFGAVVVKDGRIIARGHNQVVGNNDPTAHAEIQAIREAAGKLGRFDLSDCEIHTSCEPCPMCFSAIHWARIRKVHYGATREDAAEIGFDDSELYDILKEKRPPAFGRRPSELRNECRELMRFWKDKEGTTPY